MSAAKEPPQGQSDPTEVEFHLGRLQNKRTTSVDRAFSLAWLREHGLMPEKETPRAARAKAGKPVSQGEPQDTIPLNEGRKHKLALDDPKNLSAEFALIAAILAQPELLDTLGGQVRSEHFVGEAHRIILDALEARHRKGTPFDLDSLGDELGRSLVFVETGGKEILAKASAVTTTRSNPTELARTIYSLAIRRGVIAAARSIERAAVEGDGEDHELLADARRRIEALAGDFLDAGWERPLLNDDDAPMPFPIDVLPDGLRRFVDSAARYTPFPPEYLAVPCLTIAGAGIGRTIAIRVKGAFIEYPLLYTAVVGSRGSIKSTAIAKLAPLPVRALSRDLVQSHRDVCAAWREAKRATKGLELDDAAPQPRRIEVEDITRERVVDLMSLNPRGLVMIQDELSDWLAGMNQYKNGGGNDRQIWLKIWSGTQLTIDRKNQEDGLPTVALPFCAIAGGIQPGVLPALATGTIDDGFIDRFLFSYPQEVRIHWFWEEIDARDERLWIEAFRRLWDRRPDFAAEDKTIFTGFTDNAMKRYAEWYEAHCRECDAEGLPERSKGAWAKYRGYCARLALILEQLHWAYSAKRSATVGPVGIEALEGAITLIDYFKSHLHRVHSKIYGGRTAENSLATELLRWMRERFEAGKPPKFRASEARERLRGNEHWKKEMGNDPLLLSQSLQWLEARGAVRNLTAPARPGPGRKPAEVYEVNPLIFTQSDHDKSV